MADEIKNVETTETPVEETATAETPKKEIDTKAVIDSIFNNKPKEEAKEGNTEVKRPVNIFSKPIPVTQDDAARKARLKVVIIEGLLFGAFLTAITAIYSFSGLELKLDPENGVDTPSFWFFLLEFIFFSGAIGVGDYFLTERRVNNYNSMMAGINVDLDGEIEQALLEQEAEGITADVAAAQNKSNGEEARIITVHCTEGEDSLTDKGFVACEGEKMVGWSRTCKGVILDKNGFETLVLRMTALKADEGDFKNGVVMELINAAKQAAADNQLAAVVIPKSAYGDLELNLSDGAKYKITYSEELKVQEAYPGALMGVAGELK